MAANEDGGASAEDERFQLERFTWRAPDRVAVSGRFVGVLDLPSVAPELVVRADGVEQRIPAIPGSAKGAFGDGDGWQVDFQWREPPIAFDTAILTFGQQLSVALPQPSARWSWLRSKALPVERGPGGRDESGPEHRMGMHSDLLSAREDKRQLEIRLAEVERDLGSAHEDLAKERQGREDDHAGFRESLATVQAAADEELARMAVEIARLRGVLEERDQLRESVAQAEEALQRTASELTQAQAAVEAAAGERDALAARAVEADEVRRSVEQ